LLPRWRDRKEAPHALTALDCLGAIGSDSALLQLQRLARDPAFKGLQVKAGEVLDTVAAQRRVTREELEDRILPGLGRSDVLDFGPRQFRLSLGPDLKPFLLDRRGRRRAQLPKPTARDDAHKAVIADRQWQSLKLSLREAVKIQTRRLEEAMVTDRRWRAADFESLLEHPLLGPLARRLVWGGYNAAGRLVWHFRIAEPGYCVGLEDTVCRGDEVESVGLVHPVQLTESERLAWGEVLGLGRVGQPFPQLNRPFHLLEADQEEQGAITWFENVGVPSAFLWRLLPRQGWTRAGSELGLSGWAYLKPFRGADVTAVFQLAGAGAAGSPSGRGELIRVPRAYFLPGLPSRDLGFEAPLPLGQVDPAILSEVLNDLHVLAARGQPVAFEPLLPRAPVGRPGRRMFDDHEEAVAINWMGSANEDDIPF
jgi:hypothetical protein